MYDDTNLDNQSNVHTNATFTQGERTRVPRMILVYVSIAIHDTTQNPNPDEEVITVPGGRAKALSCSTKKCSAALKDT